MLGPRLMEAQDHPIAHFESIARLAHALKALPAQILEHEYSCESFGSWYLVFRRKGVVGRLVFDGHENELVMQKSKDRKPPYHFGSERDVGSGVGVGVPDDSMIGEICCVVGEWKSRSRA